MISFLRCAVLCQIEETEQDQPESEAEPEVKGTVQHVPDDHKAGESSIGVDHCENCRTPNSRRTLLVMQTLKCSLQLLRKRCFVES